MNAWQQFKLLWQLFFAQFAALTPEDGDEDDQNLMPFVLGIMFVPGAVFTLRELHRYSLIYLLPPSQQMAPTLEAKFFLISFNIVAVGLFMAWRWDSLFIEERDYLLLGGLPIRSSVMFVAKFTALLSAVLGVVVIVNAVSFLAYPRISAVAGVNTFRVYFAHLSSLAASATFVVLVFLLAQVFLMNVLSYSRARRLAPWVQLISLAALAVMFLSALDASEIIADIQRNGSAWVYYLPPFWFVGMYQKMLGSADPLWNALSEIARYAILLFGSLGAVTLLFAYSRHMRQVLEATPVGGSSASSAAWATKLLGRWTTRTQAERAGCEFVLQTLLRSHKHRLIFASSLALAFAFSVQGGNFDGHGHAFRRREDPSATILSVPLIPSFFAAVGMLRVIDVPVGLRASWVFDIAGAGRLLEICQGARKAFVAVTLGIPMLLAVGLYSWYFARHALPYLVMTLALNMFASLVVSRRIRTVPFVKHDAHFDAPQLSLVLFALFFAFTIYAYQMSKLQLWLAKSWVGTGVFCGLVVATTAIWLHHPIEPDLSQTEAWIKEEGLMIGEVRL